MTVEFILEDLFSDGFMVLLLQRIENTDTGSTISHYDLLDDYPFLTDDSKVIWLDSIEGELIIREFIQGSVKIRLIRQGWYVKPYGIMYEGEIIKELKY